MLTHPKGQALTLISIYQTISSLSAVNYSDIKLFQPQIHTDETRILNYCCKSKLEKHKLCYFDAFFANESVFTKRYKYMVFAYKFFVVSFRRMITSKKVVLIVFLFYLCFICVDPWLYLF